MILDLTAPVTWSDIISVAACFLTLIAVIVAMIANHNSNKQLKVSLKIQEQSKNVELLDKRIEIFDAIQLGKAVSLTAVNVLFDEEIYSFYRNLNKAREKCSSIEHDMNYYLQCLQESDGEGGLVNTFQNKIEDYQRDMERPDCPDNIYDEYYDFCKNNALFLTESGLEEERHWYNYAHMGKDLSDAQKNERDLEDNLISLMKLYIKDSIAPVKE